MKFIRLSSAFIFAVQLLFAEISLKSVGSLAIALDSSLSHNSNIFLSSSEESDIIYTLFPHLKYRSDQAAINFEAFAGLDIVQYSDFSIYNAENFKCGFSASYLGNKDVDYNSLHLSGSYVENTEAREALLDIVNIDTLNLSLKSNYYLNKYASLRSDLLYKNQKTDTDIYVDVESFEVPLALFYDYDEALSIGLGYSYGNSSVSKSDLPIDSEDHIFFIGFEDLISPLIQYQIKLGFQLRDFKNDTIFNDDDGAYAQLYLGYRLTEITQLLLQVSSGYSTSAANQSIDRSSGVLTLKHSLRTNLNAEVGFTISDDIYIKSSDTRNDNDWGMFLGLNYDIYDNCILKGSISYLKNTSDLFSANYRLTKLNLSFSYLH